MVCGIIPTPIPKSYFNFRESLLNFRRCTLWVLTQEKKLFAILRASVGNGYDVYLLVSDRELSTLRLSE